MLIRGHHQFDGQFTQVPNAWLRDERISLGAKGLLAQLLSHRPGWAITVQRLATQNGCGKDKIRTLIRELESVGYLLRSAQQRHNEKGHLAGFDYITADPPLAGLPTKVQPSKAQPSKENPAHKNTIQKKTIEKNTENVLLRQFDELWSVYPRRVGKATARKSFLKATEHWPAEDIIEGAKRLASDPNLPELQFIPHPATWLNREGWTDDPYPDRGGKKQETKRLIDEWSRTEEQ